MLKKTDKPGIYKDTKSGALVNKNTNSLSAYKAQKKLLQDARETTDKTKNFENIINKHEAIISELMKEIKSLKSAVNALKKKVE